MAHILDLHFVLRPCALTKFFEIIEIKSNLVVYTFERLIPTIQLVDTEPKIIDLLV